MRIATRRSCSLALEPLEKRACPSTVILNTLDTGWYTETGLHQAPNTNYIVGRFSNQEYRNWSFFSLRQVRQSILSAELRLFNPDIGIVTPDASETYTLFNVATPPGEIVQDSVDRVYVFNDLGDGDVYGSKSVSTSDNNTLITIPINSTGVGYLNARIGRKAVFGGAITTIVGAAEQHAFAATHLGKPIRQLVLEVDDSGRSAGITSVESDFLDEHPIVPAKALNADIDAAAVPNTTESTALKDTPGSTATNYHLTAKHAATASDWEDTLVISLSQL